MIDKSSYDVLSGHDTDPLEWEGKQHQFTQMMDWLKNEPTKEFCSKNREIIDLCPLNQIQAHFTTMDQLFQKLYSTATKMFKYWRAAAITSLVEETTCLTLGQLL